MDKIKFKEERKPYSIVTRDDRFMICTKPFNLQNTVIYTIVDLEQKIRGTENLVFGLGAKTLEECTDMLNRLRNGESEISKRNYVDLNIEWVK